ncbi:MAG: hypothetical protein GX764_04200, partial [Firmicutes bacterium]|nr:hypothetical protein [Bacillota bacterium]
GLIKTMVQGIGLVRIGQNEEGYEEGERVKVYLFD